MGLIHFVYSVGKEYAHYVHYLYEHERLYYLFQTERECEGH